MQKATVSPRVSCHFAPSYLKQGQHHSKVGYLHNLTHWRFNSAKAHRLTHQFHCTLNTESEDILISSIGLSLGT